MIGGRGAAAFMFVVAVAAVPPAAATAGEGLAASILPPVEAATHPEMASTCVTFGPRWGGMGRYFTAICFNGQGAYYAKARCYNDDAEYRSTVRGTVVWRETGRYSEGWCPFGTHPWRRWTVLL